MKGTFIFIFISVCNVLVAQDLYRVTVDLQNIVNDQAAVKVLPPTDTAQFVEYHLAKIVPGTYSISDFGRFISDISATNYQGDSLKVERLSTNRWKIESKGEPIQLNYLIHDTFDDFDGYGDNIVFEPGGTGIDAEKNVFVLNTFGFVGYLKGLQFKPYEVTILHDSSIYGSTALKKEAISPVEDKFFAEDFNFLADGPIMYCQPDTVTKTLAGATILVSVYSPGNLMTANDVMINIEDLLEAQANYLGGTLPVDRYAYLIYLMDYSSLSRSMGALEHSYSSLYSLPDVSKERIAPYVRDVAAHEFFHIVTPLNIHSKEIGEFNYIEPEMSKHLWLYEGVTEYSSMHVQVKYDLVGPDKFLSTIQEKLVAAEDFPEVSFTEMSENILSPEFEPMYRNVYEKGALIGMCLDLYLIKYSNGEKDLQWLLRELSKKYGKNTSFNDDELFDIIEGLTYPEVGTFFKEHVAGDTPLPIEKVLNWAGINYTQNKINKEITFGNVSISLNEDSEIVIQSLASSNEFASAMGYQVGDVILELNGESFTIENSRERLSSFKENTQPGDKVKVLVRREIKGKMKEKKLKAKAVEVESKNKHILELNQDASGEQYQVLQNWITAKK